MNSCYDKVIEMNETLRREVSEDLLRRRERGNKPISAKELVQIVSSEKTIRQGLIRAYGLRYITTK